jgi:hypothetical protein
MTQQANIQQQNQYEYTTNRRNVLHTPTQARIQRKKRR